MRDFFISYNKIDQDWAEWIAWHLEDQGYTTVIQAWDFHGNFILEMDKATKEAKRTIAVLSPTYITSLYTQSEWAAAFAKDPVSERDKLIPVRVRECHLEGLLAQVNYLDFVGRDEETAKRILLARVKGLRMKPRKQPIFPGHIFPGQKPDYPESNSSYQNPFRAPPIPEMLFTAMPLLVDLWLYFNNFFYDRNIWKSGIGLTVELITSVHIIASMLLFIARQWNFPHYNLVRIMHGFLAIIFTIALLLAYAMRASPIIH